MSYQSDWMSPGRLVGGFVTLGKELAKPTWGDVTCFISLFFDNLSTIVTFASIFLGNAGTGEAAELFYGRTLPGLSLALLFGNVYYAWMAARMKNQ